MDTFKGWILVIVKEKLSLLASLKALCQQYVASFQKQVSNTMNPLLLYCGSPLTESEHNARERWVFLGGQS